MQHPSNAPRRFPKPGSENLLGDVARNFQVFEPLDFIAELTQHIPDHAKHLVGYCSNKSPGMRAKAAGEAAGAVETDRSLRGSQRVG